MAVALPTQCNRPRAIAPQVSRRSTPKKTPRADHIKPPCLIVSGIRPSGHTTTYDIAGRVSTVTKPDGKLYTYTYGNYLTYETYPRALITSITDPNGNTTTKAADARGNVVVMVDATNKATNYAYDPLGRLISVTLPNNAITSITYDSLNRKTSVTDPNLGLTTFNYDAVGNLTSTTNGGKTVSYTYDALNRVETKQAGSQGVNEGVVTYTYDGSNANGVGRLTMLVDNSGTTQYYYDAMGRVWVSV